MKMYVLVIVAVLSVSTSKLLGQSSDPVYDSLATLNLNTYASKPVDSLFHVIPQSYNYVKLYGVLKNHEVAGLAICYPNGLGILIKPKAYSHMNPIDSNGVWDINLFKKEIASYITVIFPGYKALTGQYP